MLIKILYANVFWKYILPGRRSDSAILKRLTDDPKLWMTLAWQRVLYVRQLGTPADLIRFLAFGIREDCFGSYDPSYPCFDNTQLEWMSPYVCGFLFGCYWTTPYDRGSCLAPKGKIMIVYSELEGGGGGGWAVVAFFKSTDQNWHGMGAEENIWA